MADLLLRGLDGEKKSSSGHALTDIQKCCLSYEAVSVSTSENTALCLDQTSITGVFPEGTAASVS